MEVDTIVLKRLCYHLWLKNREENNFPVRFWRANCCMHIVFSKLASRTECKAHRSLQSNEYFLDIFGSVFAIQRRRIYIAFYINTHKFYTGSKQHTVWMTVFLILIVNSIQLTGASLVLVLWVRGLPIKCFSAASLFLAGFTKNSWRLHVLRWCLIRSANVNNFVASARSANFSRRYPE